MTKALCLALAGAALLGVQGAASAREPIKLTDAQLDSVAGGAISVVAGSCSAASGCTSSNFGNAGNLGLPVLGIGASILLLSYAGQGFTLLGNGGLVGGSFVGNISLGH